MNFNDYDAVIIGTGFGGSACAYVLAAAGMKVLLLERGDWARRDAVDWDPPFCGWLRNAIRVHRRFASGNMRTAIFQMWSRMKWLVGCPCFTVEHR